MKLKLMRTKHLPTHTIGQLYINDEYFCFTLEDVVREVEGQPVEKWKVWGETAIPRGTYPVFLQDSPKFGKDTISLRNVPGFSYIRIHAGNTAKDTEGCPIVGFALTHDNIIRPGTTRPAVAELKAKIKEAIETGETVTIEVV